MLVHTQRHPSKIHGEMVSLLGATLAEALCYPIPLINRLLNAES